jgi:hypothetical protein
MGRVPNMGGQNNSDKEILQPMGGMLWYQNTTCNRLEGKIYFIWVTVYKSVCYLYFVKHQKFCSALKIVPTVVEGEQLQLSSIVTESTSYAL